MEDFVANAALLAGHLTRQCEKAGADQQAAATELQHSADAVKHAVTAGKSELAQHARAAVREALALEVPAATRSVAEAGERFGAIADQLHREHASLGRRTRILGWTSIGLLAVTAVAVLAGTGYVARANMQRAERAEVRAEVLEALEQVAITSCDGRPCLKLEDGQRRWSRNDDYVLVDVDPSAGPTSE